MLSAAILAFYKTLEIPHRLPKGIVVMNPYKDLATMNLCQQFYEKYYHDDRSRTLMLGINPGRFGSGTTGISFTDPIRLQSACGIDNTLAKKPELSSDFIYRMIDAFGGSALFYGKYFISAVSPLGFTLDGKNINYYDDKKLMAAIRPFASASISRIVSMGMSRAKCFCIGEGKNHTFLSDLNLEHQWFREIVPLPHPRFIMQYRRKQLSAHIQDYINQLK